MHQIKELKCQSLVFMTRRAAFEKKFFFSEILCEKNFFFSLVLAHRALWHGARGNLYHKVMSDVLHQIFELA